MGVAGRFDNLEKSLIFVFDFFQPNGMDFIPFPLVGEDTGVAPAPIVHVEASCTCPVPLGVERRIGSNQVNGFAVHSTKHIQIIHFVKNVVGKVLLRHSTSSILS